MTRFEQPQVGVGVIIVRHGLVLLGQRTGSHGAGTWALPGGHLEFSESIASCARRETLEETGLVLDRILPAPYTNDVMHEARKHYVTCFVEATITDGQTPQIMEPEKCLSWHWCDWATLPEPLFQPLKTLVLSGFVPALLSTP